MKRTGPICLILVLLFAPVTQGCGEEPRPPIDASSVAISSQEEVGADIALVPCEDDDRFDAVRALFKRFGATDAELRVDQHGKIRNLVVAVPGSGEGTVVVGAHYDKTKEGCGAIDNWTGIVILAHLYRSVRAAKRCFASYSKSVSWPPWT